jgi:hypothetical protein
MRPNVAPAHDAEQRRAAATVGKGNGPSCSVAGLPGGLLADYAAADALAAFVPTDFAYVLAHTTTTDR